MAALIDDCKIIVIRRRSRKRQLRCSGCSLKLVRSTPSRSSLPAEGHYRYTPASIRPAPAALLTACRPSLLVALIASLQLRLETASQHPSSNDLMLNFKFMFYLLIFFHSNTALVPCGRRTGILKESKKTKGKTVGWDLSLYNVASTSFKRSRLATRFEC